MNNTPTINTLTHTQHSFSFSPPYSHPTPLFTERRRRTRLPEANHWRALRKAPLRISCWEVQSLPRKGHGQRFRKLRRICVWLVALHWSLCKSDAFFLLQWIVGFLFFFFKTLIFLSVRGKKEEKKNILLCLTSHPLAILFNVCLLPIFFPFTTTSFSFFQAQSQIFTNLK